MSRAEKWEVDKKGVFTLPNMTSYARLFRSMVRPFTLPEVNYLLELAPMFTLADPTHITRFNFIQGFSRDKKQVVSKIRNMLAFVHNS